MSAFGQSAYQHTQILLNDWPACPSYVLSNGERKAAVQVAPKQTAPAKHFGLTKVPRFVANNEQDIAMASINPTLQVWHLIQSHRVTAVIYVAAKLGIAELLRDGPLSVDELAKSTGADRQALNRLLVALSTIGICAAAGEDRYSLTELGAVLDGTAEQSFKAWAIFEGQMLYESVEWPAQFNRDRQDRRGASGRQR